MEAYSLVSQARVEVVEHLNGRKMEAMFILLEAMLGSARQTRKSPWTLWATFKLRVFTKVVFLTAMIMFGQHGQVLPIMIGTH
jgi:hypothetical protein